MQDSSSAIHSILKQYWGFDTFRPLQKEIIFSVLQGKDTLALMPTGGGKSLCFQVPAMLQPGICLVVTPLIALMKDQVQKLQQRGIPALAIYSGMHFKEIEKILNNAIYGNFKFLYVSPERLQTAFFREYLPYLKLNFIVVDEAHCISQWGYDFRPAYLKIAEIKEFHPKVAILALTATATKKVQQDILEKLLFREQNIFQKSFARHNLSYSVFCEESKTNKIISILQKLKGSSIVYCRSRRHTKEIAQLLQAQGISADYYHAGLHAEERSRLQDEWIQNKIRTMVCTNAFGMGIDKSDVRVVIHFDLPDSPEAYYQEAGRAGRDEKKAYAVLLYQAHELKDLPAMMQWQFPSLKIIREVYRSLVNYLQVPSGAGEGRYFDFDITDFSKTFSVNINLAHHVIRILEQEEILQLNEIIFLPSRVMFIANRENIFQFEKKFPALETLTKTLLRTYEGLLDNYIPVSEKQLSRLLHQPEEFVSKGLQQMQQYGVLEYFPQKNSPQILFLSNRPAVNHLHINMQHLEQRKRAYEKRVQAMINYITQFRCRSQQLLNYFEETDAAPCGICDVCLRQKKMLQQQKKFAFISEAILNLLQQRSWDIDGLMQHLTPHKENEIQEALDFLLSEEKIKLTDRQIALA